MFSLVIFVNLGCGLYFATTGAFFVDETRTSTIAIFVLYLVYSLWMSYITVKEMILTKDVSTSSIDWIFGMNAIITTLMIGAVYIIVLPAIDGRVVFIAISINLCLLTFGCCCYIMFVTAKEEDKVDARHRRVQQILQSVEANKVGGGGNGEVTVEQSLAKMINHVQKNPFYKTYTLHTGMNEYGRPFQATMQV